MNKSASLSRNILAIALLVPSAAADDALFRKTVAPLLVERCLDCHSEGIREGDLSLATRGVITDSGFVEPGDPDASYLLEMITPQNGEPPEMPKDADPLAPDEVEAIRAWIEAGAKWPEGLVLKPAHMDLSKLRSLQPIKRPVPPDIPGDVASWIRTPIDAFVLRKLAENELPPSKQADRVTLIRRLYLDMLGLPPTPEEVRDFIDDPRADAYERLVDRVLASSHYGERWGTHWLDLVRFAETHGFEKNSARPPTFHYRDYVIQTFNDDKPYDEFVFEQLAGDSVGANAATGFLVAGPHDLVLGATEAERLAKRQLDLSDMINTTGSVFLGMTIGCARCHDHKFAPISQKDYYSVQAVFAGVQHGVRSLVDPQHDPDLAQQIEEFENELAKLERAMWDLGWRPPVNFVRNVEKFPPVRARFVRMVIHAISDGEGPAIDEFEIYQAETDRNVALAVFGAKASATSAKKVTEHVGFVNNGAYGDLNDWQSKEEKCTLTLELPEPVKIDRIVWSRDRSQQAGNSLATEYHIETALVPGEWKIATDSNNRLPFEQAKNDEGEAISGSTQPRATPVSTAARAESRPREPGDKISQLNADWGQTQQRLNKSQDIYIYVGAFRQPGDVHVLDRGDPSSKREVVSPNTLSVFGSLGLDGLAPENKRRVEFAKSIIDKNNPLTARVIVNRLWHYHFGKGIVTTLSNFGISAEPPSHPELLDWLASELTQGGWSIKKLHRQILLSSTYCQSNAPADKAMSVDASCRLLWRYPMRRMEGEAIRDSVLAVSGVLDLEMYGAGFEVFEPYVVFTGYEPKSKLGQETWRRMIYMRKVREEQAPLFGAFDCPDGTQSAPIRSRSTTPIQALNLFNDEFVLEQAQILADRLTRNAGTTPSDQVNRAFQLVYGRLADRVESEACVKHIETHGLAALCRVLFNSNEFLFIP